MYLIFLIGLVSSVALSSVSAINGVWADIADYPYQVSVQYVDPKTQLFIHLCGGAILSKKWILTAAYCLVNSTKYPDLYPDMRVLAGASDLSRFHKGQLIPVLKEVVYPDFSHNGDIPMNDIALLKLTVALEFNKDVQPIGLPPKNNYESTGEALITCWGGKTKHLYYFEETIENIKDCKLSFDSISQHVMINSNICTKSIYESTCHLDSGGPLVQNGKVIGIVSWRKRTSSLSQPAIYVKVAAFIDFIKKTIKDDVLVEEI